MEMVKKIDIHAHTARVLGPARKDGTNFALPEELCQMYDQIGIEKGVLLPLVSHECTYTLSTSEDIQEIVAKYPDRYDWFCNIDPRICTNDENTDFDYLVSHYKKLGAKGLGEITANLPFDDPKVYRLFAACEKHNMPVTFHIGHTNGDYGLIDELGLPRLEKVLQAFPKLKLLGHSARFWSHIDGATTETTRHSYLTEKITPGGRLVELMRKYPNLYGDMSAGSGYFAITVDPEFGYAFLEEFQDRLFFGQDICTPAQITAPYTKFSGFLDDAVKQGKISYAAYLKVSRENALRLLEGVL